MLIKQKRKYFEKKMSHGEANMYVLHFAMIDNFSSLLEVTKIKSVFNIYFLSSWLLYKSWLLALFSIKLYRLIINGSKVNYTEVSGSNYVLPIMVRTIQKLSNSVWFWGKGTSGQVYLCSKSLIICHHRCFLLAKG